MGSWISLLASAVIGGLVLLSFQQFSNDVSQDSYDNTMSHITYGNLDEVKQIIEYDFSRIGLGVNDPAQAIITQADSIDLRYVIDSDSNGVLETMRYYLSNTAAASHTPNPNDRNLYRVVNGGTAQLISTGLTDFKVKYYDTGGNATTTPANVRSLSISLKFANPYDATNQYPEMVWRGRVTPPSLILR